MWFVILSMSSFAWKTLRSRRLYTHTHIWYTHTQPIHILTLRAGYIIGSERAPYSPIQLRSIYIYGYGSIAFNSQANLFRCLFNQRVCVCLCVKSNCTQKNTRFPLKLRQISIRTKSDSDIVNPTVFSNFRWHLRLPFFISILLDTMNSYTRCVGDCV